MKKLILQFFIIIALLTGADFLVGLLSERWVERLPDSGVLESDIIQSLQHKSADVLILGSSKSKHSFVPSIFTDSLHLTAYNAGYDGHDVIYASLVLESFLERCRPKIVILGIWNSMINGSWHSNSIHNCKPLYGINHPYTDWVDHNESWTTKLKMQSHIYRINSSMVWMLKSYRIGNRNTDGYSPLYEEVSNMKDTPFEGFNPDIKEVERLKHIIQLCRKNGIRLYITLAPDHEIDNGMRAWIAQFCKKQNVWFQDFTFEPTIYPNPSNFADAGHLSHQGAQIFTRLFISHITPK
ncbi:MAG: hypothetical protein ACI30R_10545 [Sodaliphilus sp.]